MKRLLSIFVMLCLAYGAHATHLMGGEIIVTHLSGSDYEIRVTHYRDTLGIHLSNYVHIKIDSLDATSGNYYPFGSSSSVPLNPMFVIPLLPNFPYGVEVGVYTDTVSLGTGEYRIYTNECCRNGAIENMSNPLGEGIGLYTDFTVHATGTNSSPDFLLMPVTFFPINTPSTYNALPFDIDNDSLAWGLNIPYDAVATNTLDTVTGFVTPSSTPSGPFTMNPVTGEITWTPDMLGNFVQSFEVDEYRNGVKTGTVIRDYQYIVITPPPSNQNMPSATINSRQVQYNSSQNYYYMNYSPNVPLTFTITGEDADANSTLTLASMSEIFGMADPATFTTQLVDDDIKGQLSWTPPVGFEKDVIVVFRLRDGLWSTDFTLLLKYQPPLEIKDAEVYIDAMDVYPNPADQNFTVRIENLKSLDATVEIFNTLGQRVDEIFEGTLPSGVWNMQYDEPLPAGSYLISIRTADGSSKTIPLTIQ